MEVSSGVRSTMVVC